MPLLPRRCEPVAVLLVAVCCGAQTGPRAVVGAIRWDAWHGDRSEVGKAVERSLAPAKWHGRLPFFARVNGEQQVQIDGANQQVVDREIQYARTARLDYWAFLMYAPGSAMNYGLEFYLSSTHKRGLRFCLIVEQTQWQSRDSAEQWAERTAALIARSEYQLVEGGRPLLYVLAAEPNSAAWGARHTGEALDLLRAAARSAGRGEPYVVILDYRPARASEMRAEARADAISAYAYQRGGSNAPYAQLAREAEQFWQECAATGSSVVPIVMSGWDRRPRVEHPVFWETWQKPNVDLGKFYAPPTPAELSSHLRAAVTWVGAHAAAAPAKAVLIYAWNENDEGGWLVPTLMDGSWRVQAVRRALQSQ